MVLREVNKAKVSQLRQGREKAPQRIRGKIAVSQAQGVERIALVQGAGYYSKLIVQVVSSQVQAFTFPFLDITCDMLHAFRRDVVSGDAETS